MPQNPVLNRFTLQFLFLPETNFLNIIFCSAVAFLGRRACWLGFDGLCPAVKTRVITMAPEVCALVFAMVQAPELFLLA
jgi:hypothetical protein